MYRIGSMSYFIIEMTTIFLNRTLLIPRYIKFCKGIVSYYLGKFIMSTMYLYVI